MVPYMALKLLIPKLNDNEWRARDGTVEKIFEAITHLNKAD